MPRTCADTTPRGSAHETREKVLDHSAADTELEVQLIVVPLWVHDLHPPFSSTAATPSGTSSVSCTGPLTPGMAAATSRSGLVRGPRKVRVTTTGFGGAGVCVGDVGLGVGLVVTVGVGVEAEDMDGPTVGLVVALAVGVGPGSGERVGITRGRRVGPEGVASGTDTGGTGRDPGWRESTR